jgi:cystathionine gamma-synthase
LERQCDTAERVSEALQAHPHVTRVVYPGLPEHPGHKVAASQMRRFGGVVCFTVAGGEGAAGRVCSSAQLFTLAESLGGVESLIQLPNRMTHSPAIHAGLSVPADVIRLSLGLEEADDLIADLYQAIDATA